METFELRSLIHGHTTLEKSERSPTMSTTFCPYFISIFKTLSICHPFCPSRQDRQFHIPPLVQPSSQHTVSMGGNTPPSGAFDKPTPSPSTFAPTRPPSTLWLWSNSSLTMPSSASRPLPSPTRAHQ